MIITISGAPGSGKTVVADAIAEKLKMKRYSVGNFFRQMAKEKGITLQELNAINEKEDSVDKKADEWQIEIGKKEDNFIIDGRLSYHFIPNSIKIYLDVKPEVGAKRIMKDKRPGEEMPTEEQAVKMWKKRLNSDKKRYKKYYNLDPNKKSQYNLFLDSSDMSVEEEVTEVLNFINNYGK